jgi:hypothetical protein
VIFWTKLSCGSKSYSNKAEVIATKNVKKQHSTAQKTKKINNTDPVKKQR